MESVLVTITGASGAGKSTLIKNLLKRNPNEYLQIPTYTTRPPREGEIQGEQHTFITKEEYQKMKEQNQLLACSVVENEYYGVPNINFYNVNKGKSLLLDIGAKGAMQLKEFYKNAIYVYVMPPSPERIKKNRNQNRMKRSIEQAKIAKSVCNWLIINDDLEKATTELERIIEILKIYGRNIQDIPIEDMQFLFEKNISNPKNKEFIENFYEEQIVAIP